MKLLVLSLNKTCGANIPTKHLLKEPKRI